MTAEWKSRNPYPGPRPFEREEHELFFGREREVRELLSLIIAHRTVLLYAQSGAGKTSILNAGLIPSLTKEEFEILPVARVRGFEPEDIDLKKIPNIYVFNTLVGWAGDKVKPGSLSSMPLVNFLEKREHLIDKQELPLPRAVIFDQFEELFTSYPGRWKEREEFFRQVADALEADSLLRVLFVIREDYLGSLDPYVEFLPEHLCTRYRLERLRAEAACKAVEGPLRDTECSYAEGVASRLVQQLLNIRVKTATGEVIETMGEYVEPVQLQVVCQSLWLNLPRKVTVISSDHLQEFGDVEEALRSFYEKAIEIAKRESGVNEGNLRNWFNDKLITPAGTRGTVFQGRMQSEGIPNSAVDLLEAQHIIRAEMRAGARWYELTHDQLIEPIRKSNEVWFEHQRAEEQQRQIETARQHTRMEEQAKRAKLFRRLTAVLAVMLLLAVGFAAYAFHQRQVAQQETRRAEAQGQLAEEARVEAEQQRQRAEEALVKAEQQRQIALARQLAGRAELTRNEGVSLLTRSVLLAVESMRRFPSLEADQALRGGLALLPQHVGAVNHEGPARSVAFSPDGKCLATASGHTARLWKATSGEQVRDMKHDGEVISVAFSPDGRYLATASYDNTARVWEVTNGQEAARVRHENRVFFVAFSPDGRYLATASQDNTARIWEATSGKEVRRMSPKCPVFSVAFSPDGRYLATGSWDGTARLWEVTTGKEVSSPVRHEHGVRSVVFRPDGRYLATGSGDRTARVWEVTSGKEVTRMNHDHGVRSVAFSPDGKYLATASEDRTARVWEATSGREIARMPHESDVQSVSFSPDGKCLATASLDSTARLWKATSGQEVALVRHENLVYSVAFSPDGKYLATSSSDKTARISGATTGKQVSSPVRHERGVTSVAFSPDGRYLATGSGDKTAQLWEVTTGKKVSLPMSHGDWVLSVAFSPDGRYLATGSGDKTARLWEVTTCKEVRRMSPKCPVFSVAFSPDGRYLATASEDRTARVWEVDSGKEVLRMPHEYPVYSVAFSPDGRYLATASGDRTARVWEVASAKEVLRMPHEYRLYSVAFSPDGRYLATGSGDRSARVWEATSGQEVARVHHREAPVRSVAFSPDGRYLATGSDDKTARVSLWRPEDLIAEACSRLSRNLTYEEWQQHFPDEPYRKTCPNLPDQLD